MANKQIEMKPGEVYLFDFPKVDTRKSLVQDKHFGVVLHYSGANYDNVVVVPLTSYKPESGKDIENMDGVEIIGKITETTKKSSVAMCNQIQTISKDWYIPNKDKTKPCIVLKKWQLENIKLCIKNFLGVE